MDEISFKISQENYVKSNNLKNINLDNNLNLNNIVKENNPQRNTQKSPNKTFEVIGRFKVYTLYYDSNLDSILNKL